LRGKPTRWNSLTKLALMTLAPSESFFGVSRAIWQDGLAEQFHHLGLPGRAPAPIRNMALYEIRDDRISVWRDYTDSKYAKQLLEASNPITE
jgi:hypothetical protein